MSTRCWWAVTVVLLMGLQALLAPRAYAQDPDVRSLTPVVMIVLDTSGSMEGVPGCSCPGDPNSNLCDDCYPDCGAGEKNRWALAVEALSGTFNSFQCQQIDRDDPVFTYDFGYIAPHHALPPPVTTCTLPLGAECSTGLLGALGLGVCLPLLNTCQGGSAQNDDGVLDAYLNEVRFGLMTFDTVGTYTGASQLVADYAFSDVRSESVDGMFSFGGAQDFTYPNCLSTYRTDTGARRPAVLPESIEGSLISAGTDSSNWQAINAQIQASLRQIRPFGGTPIAASLSDLDYYFRNHPDMTTDAYSACRGRFGVLITDGKPDSDFRQFGCDQPGFQCPYPLPEDQAGILRCGPGDPTCGGGSNNGSVEKLFVIGLDVTDPAIQADLDLIAQRGGNPLDTVTGHYALFASDATSITTALAGVLDETQAFPVSRTTPLNIRTRTASYRITAAFERPGGGLPWNGLLERQRLGCDDQADPPLTPADQFHLTLNNNPSRELFSALPLGAVSPNATLISGVASNGCGINGCQPSQFGSCSFCSGPPVGHTHTGSADAAAFNTLANWVHGGPGSGRESTKLGAIYHSSPVYVDAPKFDAADASFNLFRASADAVRPDVIYTGTNDGILHAFRVESTAGFANEGEEIWGFIPPMLLDKLPAAMASPQIMLDGTPVAKNVVFSRLPGTDADGSEYKTVVVSGMRQGGRGYFALDVTDPEAPEFLWQIADPDMGFTYGRPAVVQVNANFGGTNMVTSAPRLPSSELGGGTVMQRAIALLAGGTGNELPGACDSARDSGGNPFETFLDANATTPTPGPVHRAQHRCWDQRGRTLYFIDMKTGHEIHRIDHSVFRSPLVGTPAAFNGAEGAVATRAFVADADGVIWRIDFSSPNPNEWVALPFHDMAWGLGFDQGQPGYEPPVLSVDEQNRVVVIFGQGNLDNFENPNAISRMVSLTEVFTDLANPLPPTIKAGFNWEFNLPPSALVTGPPVLFEGIVMFATFRPVALAVNACSEGQGAIYAFDYLRAGLAPNTGTPATPTPLRIDIDGGVEFNEANDAPPSLLGKLVMGLSVVQKPPCVDTATMTSVLPGGWAGSPAAVPSGPATFEVVGNTASGIDQTAQSDIGQIRRLVQLNPRTRVISWAGATD